MGQKPKHTYAELQRRRKIKIMVIILVVIGLVYAGLSYGKNVLDRATAKMFEPIMLTLDADTETPVPTYMLTLTAFSMTSSPSSLDTVARQTATPGMFLQLGA